MHKLLASGNSRLTGHLGLHCLRYSSQRTSLDAHVVSLPYKHLLRANAAHSQTTAAAQHQGDSSRTAVAMQASPQQHGNVAAAKLITSDAQPSSPRMNRPPYIIGVCGGTASGKTSVCTKIIEGLMDINMEHRGIVSLPQDCFYRDLTPEEAANIQKVNFDHPRAFAVEQMVATLRALKAGQPADIPVYDFVTSARLPHVTHVKAADVVLFDGILAFYWPELRELFDLKVFVDADADTRLSRRCEVAIPEQLKRDIVERGRDVIAVLEQYENTVKPSFEAYTLPTKAYADIIVPRGIENTKAIDLLLQDIRLQLTGRREPVHSHCA